MEFRILGPLQVLDRDGEVQIGSPKERALLAVLLLSRGDVVSRERLIDELWGETPPPTAAKALNVHVSLLRKSLGRDGRDPVLTKAPGYALELDRGHLDADRFEHLVEDARSRAASGDSQSSSELFGAALALWRGPALADVELEAQARNEVARLEELRLRAQIDRIDCELALGMHEAVVGELEGLVSEHPLRERLRSQLMLALYRSGRPADALQAYQDARKTFVEELGLEPSPALQRLERAILNHDSALEAPAGLPTAIESPTENAHGRHARLLVAFALAIGAAAVAALVAFLTTRGGGRVEVPPNSVAIIDPGANAVVRAIGVGIDPGAVSVGAGAVWVANEQDKLLSRIDPETRAVTRNLSLDGTPTGVAATRGAVWVAYGRLGSVARVDPEFDSVGRPLRVAGRGYGFASADGSVAAGPQGVWVAFGDSTVARISSDGARVLLKGYAGSQPSAVALGDRAVWVANEGSNTVSQFDPQTATEVARTSVATSPRGVALGGGVAWASAFDADAVSVVARGSSSIPVGNGPAGVAYGAGSVWVANSRDGTVSRIDPRRRAVVATIRIGHHPEGVAVGAGAVWVTVRDR